MPSYKLIYANARGFAEQSRFVFAQADVPYEDKRIDFKTEWADMKPTMDFGSVPVLEVDGVQISGSVPIARYLGEAFGLAGCNPVENAQIGGLVDFVQDITLDILKFRRESDESRKDALKEKLTKETIPQKLSILEKRAAANDDGWMFNKLTWGDFCVYMVLGRVLMVDTEGLNNFPNLKKLQASVEKLPRIAKWIENRPKTEF